MDYNELEKLWNRYDDKLNKLGTLNKLVLIKTISQSSQKKIYWLQFQNYYGVIIVPLILIFVFHSYLIPFNPEPKLIIGSLILFLFVIYSTWHFIYGIIQLKKVDVARDSVMESVNKINRYKTNVINRYKAQLITGPVLLAAIILIGWKGFTFDLNFYLFTAFLIMVTFLFAKRGLKQHKERIKKLLSDVEELNDYKD